MEENKKEAVAEEETVTPATEEDWDTEYLAATLSVRVVPNINAAMEHIAEHGSGHTDGIISDARVIKTIRKKATVAILFRSSRLTPSFKKELAGRTAVKCFFSSSVALSKSSILKFISSSYSSVILGSIAL